MRVKGSLFLDYVKMIRSNQDKNWDQYLQPADWEIVHGHILPSNWYPFETFARIGWAVFQEVAGGNLELVRAFGRFSIKRLLELYKNILVPGDPAASAERLALLHRTFLEGGGQTRVVAQDRHSFRYKVFTPASEVNAPYVLPFYHQIAGNLEELIEQAGGKKIKLEVVKVEDGCEIAAKWE